MFLISGGGIASKSMDGSRKCLVVLGGGAGMDSMEVEEDTLWIVEESTWT